MEDPSAPAVLMAAGAILGLAAAFVAAVWLNLKSGSKGMIHTTSCSSCGASAIGGLMVHRTDCPNQAWGGATNAGAFVTKPQPDPIAQSQLTAQGEGRAKEPSRLLSIEEAEEEAHWRNRVPTGVACPKCGSELWRSPLGMGMMGPITFHAWCRKGDWEGDVKL